ncbi:MAG: type II 3-dehydroquinate dehydratase [Gammaproteobacteria bacterium]|nr:type II 3-dehydroquinate dehydratase [Gammaproteobacteria bacterium]MCB1861635.1 type II 3-dehydroquinate dehydratase [Gammaproteobacteria bacterium]MCB1873061.1 type II 3-dehydroquinate dehydratase [Gammaproteobacteria bacterium]MCB1902972.1 type II 3-dehydroquinate dehydratase [Gammaproteobacteria bacterium]
MSTILVLNGPNLNLLGSREPEHYGRETLESIKNRLSNTAQAAGHQLEFAQSNAEHELIELIHNARNRVDFIIFNPAAFTHTSIALRDAILGVHIPFIEVHLSNVYSRDEFRRHSFFSDIAKGIISGLGAQGYELALQAALRHITFATQN